MADAPSSPATNPLSNPQSANPNPQSNQPDPVPASTTPPPPPPPPSQSSSLSSTPITVNPDSNPPLVSLPPPPSHPSISFAPQQVSGALPPVAPSFRPVPQFTPIPNPGVPNPNYQIPGVQPPGVSSGAPMAPGVPPPSSTPQHMMHYQMQPMRPYAPMPNGYAAMTTGAPQGALPGTIFGTIVATWYDVPRTFMLGISYLWSILFFRRGLAGDGCEFPRTDSVLKPNWER